ncbi:hypothetical protein SH1V18_38480 [Vallitalea longa]|uniref:Uncharacterized protein n=1 Tax=Vallitalea longa TaxID=2936439 RepID=A0A9W6DHE3_9FIRM|nr:hypothetical protein [Vallitalea longa]GKX31368.1 hypothetical protein SH1V18_38480 [Vallitalea longa]
MKNNEMVPIEVTCSIDPKMSEIRSLLKNNRIINTKLSIGSWRVIPKKESKIKNIKKEIEVLLKALDENKISKLYCDYPFSINNKCNTVDIKKIYSSLCRLRIEYVKKIAVSSFNNKIIIGYPCEGTIVEEKNINIAVRNECLKEDNIKKLNTNLKERHFVIYVDESNYSVWKPMVYIHEPVSSPQVNMDNLIIWLITSIDTRFVIWKSDNGGKWEIIHTNI